MAESGVSTHWPWMQRTVPEGSPSCHAHASGGVLRLIASGIWRLPRTSLQMALMALQSQTETQLRQTIGSRSFHKGHRLSL